LKLGGDLALLILLGVYILESNDLNIENFDQPSRSEYFEKF
jgi:hypothetical protein